MKLFSHILTLLLIVFSILAIPGFGQEAIQLIVRGDDMGFCHATNEACIQAYQEGILTTTEVMVVGPWFLDAAEMLCDNPGLDVGVHLTLTSEWANYKWGPITNGPSLVTEDGYFPISNDRFTALEPSSEEIEAELRRQIELAIEHIPQVSHVSFHMGTSVANQEWTMITYNLALEYNLLMNPADVSQGFDIWGEPADGKEDALNEALQNLQPGLTLFVCHPAYDNAETQAIRGIGGLDPNMRMSVHRDAITRALCSDRIKQTIEERNIQILNYPETYNTSSASPLGKINQQTFVLQQNYPNPFNPTTTIGFNLTKSDQVLLKIFNVQGQEVTTLLDKVLGAGGHAIQWHADGLAGGIYSARLQAGSEVKTMNLILQK